MAIEEKGNIMALKKIQIFEKSDIEKEMDELLEAMLDHPVGSAEREELREQWLILDDQLLEWKKLKYQTRTDVVKSVLGHGITILVMLTALGYEHNDVFRSKVTPFWVKRNWD